MICPIADNRVSVLFFSQVQVRAPADVRDHLHNAIGAGVSKLLD